MARRSSLFNDISKLPWQVGVILAVLTYPAAMYFKSYFAENTITAGLGIAVTMIWPLFSALFLIAAFSSFIRSRNKSAIFKSHRSIEKIRNLSWQQFEQFVGSYFKDQGYLVIETPAGPDGGIDLVLRKDGKKTYVQCKHWKTYKVGVDKVRELLGAMTAGGADLGVLVTTGEFTASALEFGSKHAISLIAGAELESLLRDDIIIVGSDSPASKESLELCPACQSTMILRTAKKGPNPGAQFLGCSRFPVCRGTSVAK